MNNKQKTTRIIAGILVLSFLVALFLGLMSSLLSVNASDLDSELNSLKGELSSIEKEKEAINQTIKNINKDISSTQEAKANIDREIDVLSREIDVQEKLVSALNKDINVKSSELKIATDKLDEQYDKYKLRVRAMYENGETSYLDVVLGSENFVDMISRVEIISQIVDYDKKLVTEFNETKTNIQNTKTALENSKAEEVAIKSKLSEKKSSLNAKSNKSQALLSNLNSDKAKSKAEWEKADKLELKLQAEIQEIARKLAANSNGSYVGGEFLWPTPGYNKITSNFGYRKHPILGYNKLHSGMDIGAASGSKILAVNSGTVVKSTFNDSYGNYVMVDHGGGIVTLYAHMSSRNVKTGDVVARGQQIGKVGSTGWSTGPHLHIEVIKNGNYVDPKGYF